MTRDPILRREAPPRNIPHSNSRNILYPNLARHIFSTTPQASFPN